jgi:hypothetical protein
MCKDSLQQKFLNDLNGLTWINRFKFLRPLELARLLWPSGDPKHLMTYGSRITSRWLDEGLVIRRILPKRAGTAFLLSERGANFLRNEGIDARSGKGWGTRENDKWRPPASWEHDLLATGLITLLYQKKGFKVIPDHQLRVENPLTSKIPDGLLVSGKAKVWLEIESKTKKSSDMTRMAESLAKVMFDKADILSGIKANVSVVGYSLSATDSRNYKIDHKLRIVNALKKKLDRDQTFMFLQILTKGKTVTGFKRENIEIHADDITFALNEISWDDFGNKSALYGHLKGLEITILRLSDKYDWAVNNSIENERREQVTSKLASGLEPSLLKAKRSAVKLILDLKLD